MVMFPVMMVLAGSLSIFLAKRTVGNQPYGVSFSHPLLQTLCMFFGQFLCLVVFCYKRHRWNRANIQNDKETVLPRFNYLLYLPAAICNTLATSIMFIGLTLTSTSSFQMLRGAVIIFIEILSVLGAQTKPINWVSMIFVMEGLVIVGVSDHYSDNNHPSQNRQSITGDVLIILAQFIVAYQELYEKKYLTNNYVPALFAVGLKGLFGMITSVILMVPCYYIHVSRTFSSNPEGRLEDVFYAWKHIKEMPAIAITLMGFVISIALFKFARISVTQKFSTTARVALDSIITLVVWTASILMFREDWIAIKIAGFAFLTLGTFVYSKDIAVGPWFRDNILPYLKGHDGVFAGSCGRSCGGDAELIQHHQKNDILEN